MLIMMLLIMKMMIKMLIMKIDDHTVDDHHVDHEDDDHDVDRDAGQLQCCCSVCRWAGSGRYEASSKTKEDLFSFVKNSTLEFGRPCNKMPILNKTRHNFKTFVILPKKEKNANMGVWSGFSS